ncbi:glycosyltransferase [Sphingobium bisphenolivorans]|uniref:glycosyltransferase n=1 Tax=Sphingobium bisphenolivorans TaxID=1335760 RepID=UPI00039A3782|nr:glycosyltransferase [Sphingobium bisphenolivorans]
MGRYNPLVIADNLVSGHDPQRYNPHLLHKSSSGRLRRLCGRLTGNYALQPPGSPSLIHAHFLQDGAGILSYALRRRLPLIVTAHGYDATVSAREHARRTEGMWYLALKPFLIRYVEGIVCVSNWIKHCLMERGYPEEKLRVIRLGIDADGLPQARSAYHRRGALFVGRLVEKKGVRHLLDAWAKLPPALQEEPLTIIGDGPLMPELRAQAERLGIKPHFLGPRPREQVFDAMARHRIFAMPSMRAANGDSEGLPIVLMEAQAMGMPVIVFDEGPMREAILPGQSGLLARAGDTDDYASHLGLLLRSGDLSRDLGEAGRTHVRKQFDVGDNVGALEDFYDEVIARHQRSS